MHCHMQDVRSSSSDVCRPVAVSPTGRTVMAIVTVPIAVTSATVVSQLSFFRSHVL